MLPSSHGGLRCTVSSIRMGALVVLPIAAEAPLPIKPIPTTPCNLVKSSLNSSSKCKSLL